MAAIPDPETRFRAKVDTSRGRDGCHLWRGYQLGGYGAFKVNNSQTLAHRFAWELANGRPIPEGLMVRHACHTPLCVNPWHLLIGTAKDNARDRQLAWGINPGGRPRKAS